MNKISQDRLIELAEGFEKPTADEKRLIETDAEVRAELEELIILFKDLCSQPGPVLDQEKIAGILPGVRAKITDLSGPGLFVRKIFQRPANNIFALAASLLVLIGLIFYAPGSMYQFSDPDLLSYGFATLDQSDPALDVGVLQLQVDRTSDLELFNSIDESLGDTDSSEILDENTFDLMNQAASFDTEEFKRVKEVFAVNF